MKPDYDAILKEAHAAASAAQAGMVENPYALDCGFAWVTVSGNDPLARYCRKVAKTSTDRRFTGSKGYPSGWQWWCPGAFSGQAVGIHEVGAGAFRDTLGKYGIRADVHSRLD